MEACCLERKGKIINIDDVIKNIEVPDVGMMPSIFQHQKELMVKYDEIERDNGLLVPDYRHGEESIDSCLLQQRIKDMFWRMTEELAEAVECLPVPKKWAEQWDKDVNIHHFFEELADALHFLVEATIISKINVTVVQPLTALLDSNKTEVSGINGWFNNGIRFSCAKVIFAAGTTANCLKNKPWKQTQMPTDVLKFHNCIVDIWAAFFRLFGYLGCDKKMVYVLYAKKNLVNKWRQETNY